MPASKERIEEVKQRLVAVGITVLRMGRESIKRPMTEQELAELAKEMDEHIIEHARLEERKKESAKAYKDSMDKEIEEARALAEMRDKGYHDIEENCIIGYDAPRNLICIFDPVTGLESFTRMVTDKDLQTKMPLEPEEGAKEAVVAPEAIQIGYDGGNADQGPIEVEGVVIGEVDMGAVLEGKVEEGRTTITDMIRSVEPAEGGFTFIETVEATLYTDDAEIITLAQQVMEAKAYADFEIEINAEARNKQVFAITPKVVEEPEEVIQNPEGVEGIEDID